MAGDSPKKKRRGERDDGRILVTYTIGRNEKGKTVRKYFYGNTRAEAEKKRDRFIAERNLGISSLSEKITVREWITIWYDKYKQGIDESTARTYKTHIKQLNAQIGSKRMRSVSEIDLQSALNEVAGKSESTIDKYYSLIRQVFGKAYNNRLIPFDPSIDLKPPSGHKGGHRALERWESELIMNNWQKHRVGLWAMIFHFLGLRRGELIALDWEDIDLKNRQADIHQAAAIHVNQSVIKPQTKTQAGMRVIPICDPLYKALLTVPEKDRVGLVCKSVKGKQLSESAFSRGWESFNNAMTRILANEPLIQQGRRRDLEDPTEEPEVKFHVRAHDLRYTFATALYDADVSVKAAQYYLGHSDVRMTMDLYTKLSTERKNRERSKLTTFLDKWIGIQHPVEEKPGGNSDEISDENLASEGDEN